MAERLTRNNKVNFYFHDEASNMVYYKLQKLEDIMEKYHCNDIEELEQELKIAHEIERLKDKNIDLNNAIIVFNKNFIKDYIREIEELKVVSDTWKRACELACENMKLPVDILIGNKEFNECHSIVEYFYQQAKTEGSDE